MAVYAENDFDAGTTGTDATGSSTTASGDTLTRVRNGSATATYTDTAGQAISGVSVRLVCGTAGTDNCYYLWNHSGVAQAGLRASVMIDANPSATTQILALRRATSGVAAYVQVLTTGVLRVMTAAGGGGIYDTPSAMSADTHYQVDLAVQPGTGTGDGKVTFAVYDAAGDLACGMASAYASTTQNCGTGNIVRGLVGVMESGGILTASIDNLVMTDTYALVGPLATAAEFHRVAGAWVARETFSRVSGAWS